ncbi:MAK10-like protein [Tanacetum coccineum]
MKILSVLLEIAPNLATRATGTPLSFPKGTMWYLFDLTPSVDSLDLDVANRERMRLRLFQFSLRDQASNWLERLPAGSISIWEDLTTRFLAQFFSPGRTAKLRNHILMFQQHQRESLSEAWTRFKDLLQKVPHHGIDLWLQVQIFYDHVNPVTRRTIDQSVGGKLRDMIVKESWALLEDLALYDNKSWNDPRDFAKPVKAISLPQDVPSTSDRRLIELENQVQCLMEAYLAPKQPIHVNKITSSCEICSGPHDTQYCVENLEQTFVDYVSSRTDEEGGKWYTFKPEHNNLGDTYNPSWKSHPNLRWRQPQNSQNNFSNPPNRFQQNGSILNRPFNNNPQSFNNQSDLEGLVSNFMASQDARLSKFEADFKQKQSKMTNKIDTVLKAITDRIMGALPSDTIKNPKLNVNSTSSVLSARSYPTEDPYCSSHPPNSINTIKACSKETNHSQKDQLQTDMEIGTQQPKEPEQTLEDEFRDLHLNIPVLEVLGLFSLPCRLGDSKSFDTLADLGSCMNIISLYLFKKLKMGLLEETDHVFKLAYGTKSYPIGIVRDVEVHIGRLKLLNDFYIINMKKDPKTPLLVGRGFLAIANAVIDCRKSKIAVGEGITRSYFLQETTNKIACRNFSRKTNGMFSQCVETASGKGVTPSEVLSDSIRIFPDGVWLPDLLFLMRRSLEVLRKFQWMILGGRFNQLSHVSSLLLSKPPGSTMLSDGGELSELMRKVSMNDAEDEVDEEKALSAAWRPRRPITFKELDSNIFLVHIDHYLDFKRALEDGPWSFERNLVVLKPIEKDEQPIKSDMSKRKSASLNHLRLTERRLKIRASNAWEDGLFWITQNPPYGNLCNSHSQTKSKEAILYRAHSNYSCGHDNDVTYKGKNKGMTGSLDCENFENNKLVHGNIELQNRSLNGAELERYHRGPKSIANKDQKDVYVGANKLKVWKRRPGPGLKIA